MRDAPPESERRPRVPLKRIGPGVYKCGRWGVTAVREDGLWRAYEDATGRPIGIGLVIGDMAETIRSWARKA